MALSLGGMISAAYFRIGLVFPLAAVVFALTIAIAAFQVNKPFRRTLTAEADTVAAQRNAALMTLTYLWGAVALFSVYGLTGLAWRHSWQYGLGLGVLAVLLGFYAYDRGRRGSWLNSPPARRAGIALAIGQSAAIFGGLVFLAVSGKLTSVKDDWAAHYIFLFGGCALVTVSTLAAITGLKPQAADKP